MKTFQTFDISAAYDDIHRTFPCYKKAPVIGLTGNFRDGECTLAEGYFTSILKAGGVPFILPSFDDTDSLINALESLDGILLTGGADINPLFMDEEPVKELHSINPHRDRQELLLTKLAGMMDGSITAPLWMAWISAVCIVEVLAVAMPIASQAALTAALSTPKM